MGVRIGVGRLAGAVINEGGIGVIASVGLADIDKTLNAGYIEDSECKLVDEIRIARSITGSKGPLGVNVMVALTNYESLVRTAVKEGVDLIISGAGLPLRLPAYVDEKTALVPVVSSGRALKLVMKTWRSKYDRVPDAIILEGPLCGGHLGFSYEQIEHPETCSIDKILAEAREVLGEEHKRIPLIAAEGVTCRADIDRYLAMGFAGVQIGTRFICTAESGMERKGQEHYIRACAGDVTVVQSPVGLPVRVLRSPLVERMLSGQREKFKCPYKCLITCDMKKVPFCIAQALLAAREGDWENGLFMTGCNVDPITQITTVKEFIAELLQEANV